MTLFLLGCSIGAALGLAVGFVFLHVLGATDDIPFDAHIG